MLRIINLAAQRYRGVIPKDCWHEPYMPADELAAEMAAGVEFWGAELDAALVGVMGIQQVRDVDLIRHAYVLPAFQGRGIEDYSWQNFAPRGHGLSLSGLGRQRAGLSTSTSATASMLFAWRRPGRS